MAKYFTLGHLKIFKWNYSSTVLAAKVWVLYDKNVHSQDIMIFKLALIFTYTVNKYGKSNTAQKGYHYSF